MSHTQYWVWEIWLKVYNLVYHLATHIPLVLLIVLVI
nr:MAG TPA: hypothetical protein [Caudoviricetes sp.]